MNLKKCLWVFSALCFITFSCSDEENLLVEEPEDQGLKQYIVVFKDGAVNSGREDEPAFTDREAKIAYADERSAEVERQLTDFYQENNIDASRIQTQFTNLFGGFAAKLNDVELARLSNDPRVDFIEEDQILTLDFKVEAVFDESGLSSGDNGGRTEADFVDCAIDNAGGAGNGSNDNNRIWIVDTGIDLDHPDLNVDRNLSRSFADGSADDSNGHGTHVAGIAAAINNNIGVRGVSAGARVVAVDVLGSGSAPTSTIIRGMDYVASRDISGDVVNMSLGPRNRTGCPSNSAYRSALERLNNQSRIALAAGNSSDDARFYDPACRNLSRVYTVASMTCNRGFSSFSNFGTPVDWIATGSDVVSTYRNGQYARLSGTSMASPVVAGILHQRNRAPRQCGSVNFRGRTYRIACR